MGFEYIIKYRPTHEETWRSFVERLDNPPTNGWPAFDVELTPKGVYFCDHTRSSAAAIAFRRIVDEALAHSDSVIIAEA